MPSTPAPPANALRSLGAIADPIERLGALAKWVLTRADEMVQLDARIERQLEHLQRTEENLRTVFESLRQQVTAAHEATGELRQLVEAPPRPPVTVDAAPAQAQLAEFAAQLQRQLADQTVRADQDFNAVFASAIAFVENAQTQLTQQAGEIKEEIDANRPARQIEQWRLDADSLPSRALEEITLDFQRRSAELIESVRAAAVEQVERLSTQAAVAVEPILRRIERQREQSELQLRTALESTELAMQRRAEELARAGDAIVDNVEQRLARRITAVRPRTTEAIESMENSFQQRISALLEGVSATIANSDEDFTRRISQIRPRMREMLQSVRDDLSEQLSHLESEALTMTSWLERRMESRVEALISRTREGLANPTPSISPAPEPAAGVEVEIFVDGNTLRRPEPASLPAVD